MTNEVVYYNTFTHQQVLIKTVHSTPLNYIQLIGNRFYKESLKPKNSKTL